MLFALHRLFEFLPRRGSFLSRGVQASTIMEKQGALVVTNKPEQLDAIISTDTERNTRILKDAGVAGD